MSSDMALILTIAESNAPGRSPSKVSIILSPNSTKEDFIVSILLEYDVRIKSEISLLLPEAFDIIS